MHNVVIDQPYQFIPPVRTRLWPALLKRILPWFLRREYGITRVECRHVERLRKSLAAGHGILLAPNHCRMSDPMVLGVLARQAKTNLFAMASWHLFMQGRFMRFMIRRMGAFSVYREGLDRQAVNQAIEILAGAQRPLILFPEGAVSRHNDQLMALMDGTALIARTAAKRRAKQTEGGKVVVHPVAIRYNFRGDLEATLRPVLTEIEQRLSWHAWRGGSLIDRIGRLAEALLSLREIEYFGSARQGDRYQRVRDLIDHLLVPLEEEWKISEKDASVVSRVKRLRAAILQDMVNGQIAPEERERRWHQLADCYLAQQMSHYPEDYIQPEENIPEHVLETVERFEEDFIDRVRVHGPLHVVIEVGEPLEVAPERRGKGGDPLMQAIEEQLKTMLAALAKEAVQSHAGQQAAMSTAGV